MSRPSHISTSSTGTPAHILPLKLPFEATESTCSSAVLPDSSPSQVMAPSSLLPQKLTSLTTVLNILPCIIISHFIIFFFKLNVHPPTPYLGPFPSKNFFEYSFKMFSEHLSKWKKKCLLNSTSRCTADDTYHFNLTFTKYLICSTQCLYEDNGQHLLGVYSVLDTVLKIY